MPQDNLDPLRHIEGFPLGEDEDLHALSNPPYYTAYPNPHIADFIAQYGKPYDEATDDYHREPFVSDVSEGKSDPIYRAVTYHTKVPYLAIVPFIEHYCEPGSIVFDGFCGTGMTGIATQHAGCYPILNDLSILATQIANSYNSPADIQSLDNDFKDIIHQVNAECSWMFETTHLGKKARVIYTVWSDVFVCSYCGEEVVLWDETVDLDANKVKDNFPCPRCSANLSSGTMERSLEIIYDDALEQEILVAKQKPVLISYKFGGHRFEKRPDQNDIKLISKISLEKIPYWYPSNRMPDGDEARRNDPFGMTHTHLFFTKRNLWVLASFWDKANKAKNRDRLLNLLVSILDRMSYRNRYMPQHRGNRSREVVGPLSGTLYVPMFSIEVNPLDYVTGKTKGIIGALSKRKLTNTLITTQSSADLLLSDETVDYIFTDPPFGSNLMYSELNYIGESWLRCFTNNKPEAVINKTQQKSLEGYRNLMTDCFSEFNRVLKPGRWITVVFHNSKASVWNAIQDSLARAGFLVAQVTVMDKQKGTTKQLTYPSAVKNDLVINAYKPRASFTQRLISQAGRGLEADFVREHLRQLPIAANVERSKEMLYSKYLAYYVQHGYQVAYNGEQFYRALAQWGLDERDGYWFADETQAQEYEQRKVKSFGKKGVTPQAVLFVSDERSARQWVWNFLDEPKTYDEIYTAFVKALQTKQDEIPELKDLLEESFVRTNGHWKRPDQLTHAELEQKRLERLLRQFNEYLVAAKAGQKIKEVRREAVLAGFTECYRAGKFQDIIILGKKLDKRLLEESPELFDFVDIAEAKIEG